MEVPGEHLPDADAAAAVLWLSVAALLALGLGQLLLVTITNPRIKLAVRSLGLVVTVACVARILAALPGYHG